MKDIRDDLARGEAVEALLDRFFSKSHVIEKVATPKRWYDADPPDPNDYRVQWQRRDIDRVFTRKRDGWASTISYKSDFRAAQTGNAFVEILSREGKPGWAYSCCAQWLVYYVVGHGMAYAFLVPELREHAKKWEAKYPHREVANRSAFGGAAYTTTGILVPLHAFEAAAKHCFLIDPDPPDEPLPSDAETDAA